ncbi:hypothetical protein KRMM14A1259_05350 [Krasilnikovia sp. MM14-A1259]
MAVAGVADSASAQVPGTATRWSSLMYHSLTPTPQYVRTRKVLAAQRAALVVQGRRVASARTVQGSALAAVTTAVSLDAYARTRYAVAREDLASARNRLVVVSQQRPSSAVAVARAKNVVTASAKSVVLRRTQAHSAAAALRTAQVSSRTATVNLDRVTAAWQRTSAAIRTNQRRLIALDHSAEYAAQAAAISRSVVTDIQARFTTADTTTVNGITVHKSVAFAFRRMLADAKTGGIVLSGGGYRTKQQQIELRKINGCPDVWTAPPSSCRVPTAIPGTSLHEFGLAIDITSGGSTITRDSDAFRWLSAHAARYGFVNLPSEAWHWSITGA